MNDKRVVSIPLFNTLREKNPEAPIVLVENIFGTSSVLNKKMEIELREINLALKTEYQKIISEGYTNIFYVKSKNATYNDNEGMVDGVHFTYLDFTRYLDFLMISLLNLDL